MAKSPTNSTKMKIHLNAFSGGAALDYKYGIANSFYYSQGIDFRQKASQMSILPAPRALSATLSDLITCMIQDPNGVRYGVGNQGYLYRISTNNVISEFGKLNSNGGAGIVYNQQSDQLYISGQQTASLYGQVSTSVPQLRNDNFGPSASVSPGVIFIFDTLTLSYDGNVDTNTGLTTQRNNLRTLTTSGVTPSNYTGLVTNTLTNTYTLPSVISENSGQLCPFIPDIEPFYSVAVWVTAIGTGNWTLTMHDSLNNNLGSVTISHSSMVVGLNNFVFTAPGIRAIPTAFASGTSAAYHFHLTSSVSSDTATVATIAENDLTGCNMIVFAYRFVQTHNGWHPMANFSGMLCIGNGNYLSTYNYGQDANPNNNQWIRHQLGLDTGYEVCGLTVNNQYLVIAAEKRSMNSTRNYQDGMLYFWDGTNVGPNFKIEIPMGAPYSPFTFNNVTYFYCAGSLFAWGGGQSIIKVRYIAYQNTDYLGMADSTIVNPNMMDARYNLLMLGFPSITTNTNITFGVYSWGAVELTYPNSFCLSYILSNGLLNSTSSNALQIGTIKNFVDTMYTSWQYTDSNSVTHYGLDILDNTSTAAPTFTWQSLIYDGGARYKTKEALRYKVAFVSLPANCTISPWYILDRGTKIYGTKVSTAGSTAAFINISGGRFKEAQWGFDGTCSNVTTPPIITAVTMEIDPLTSEVDLRPELPA